VTLIFVISLLVAPKRGALARIYRHSSNRRRTLQENVLKAMHQLGEADGDPFTPRSIEEIKTRRQLPDALLHRALRRLRAHGYLEPAGSGRWKLTAEGSRQGERVTRLHRLWEVYLTDYVQIAADHVHDDAESIEHVLTPELEEELQRLLDRPMSDPHEKRIPYAR
jgi:manganese/zinc/iron transport system permease protein